jgi:predicted transcriptional regulator
MGNTFSKKRKYNVTRKRDAKKELLDLLTDVGEQGIFQAEISGKLTLSTTYVSMLLKDLEEESRIIKRKEIGKANRIWLFNKAPKEESIRALDTKTQLYPVYLGFVPAAEYAALFFAEKTVFKKHGINLKLIQFQNVEDATFALGKGLLDLCVTPVITQIAVALRTGSLKIIAGAGREGSAIMIRNDLFGKSICNVEDLKDRRIGSSKLSAMEMNLRTILENNGLDSYADCKIIFYNSPEVMYHALKT